MEDGNYTIKNITYMAGISAGTVNRMLHNRGNVSRTDREKIQKVLDEIDYHPNMFAIGLATRGRYHIICVIPYYIEHDYWSSVVQGIGRAAQESRPFSVEIDYVFYNHADRTSYEKACALFQTEPVDAVLITPSFQSETLRLTSYLESKKVPYAFIDFGMEQTHTLYYIDQDSKASGYIAAKILMNRYREGQEIVLFLNNQENDPAEIQMQRRLEGFIQYFVAERKDLIIHDVVPHKENTASNKELLDIFFAEHPKAALGAVFNSHVYQVADYLQKKGHRLDALVGYDLPQKNVGHLESGKVNYLIKQWPGLQGYCGAKTLCNHIVFKRPVTTVKYMPIGILMKENIDFYFEFE